MTDDAFLQTVSMIHQTDPRYEEDAYFFVRDALSYATKNQKKPDGGSRRHVTGTELLESIKDYALQEFGPMTHRVLKTWGILRTDDFGEIVFNLVESGTLGKTEEDRKEDFAGGFDFTEAFVLPFRPAASHKGRKRPGRKLEEDGSPADTGASDD